MYHIETNLEVSAISTNNKITKTQLLTLAAVFAISPFAIDSYLPAIPSMALGMNVDISLLSVTVSLYVFGLAIGQLIGGPLSDKKGRGVIMAFGLAIFAVASLLLTTGNDIFTLWLWRFVQAIGGGIAVVGVPAIIRDRATGKEAAKLYSLIALIMMIAPSIAPTVGTLILKMADWQWIFYLLAVLALSVAAAVLLSFPQQRIKKQHKVDPMKGGLLAVFKEKKAIGFMVAQAFAYATMMTYITNASMLYMTVYDVTTEHFSMLFIANVCGLVTINRLNSLLLRWYEPVFLLKLFLLLQLTGGAILISAAILAPDNLYLAATGFVIAIGANGGITSNSSACFLKFFGHNAGSASAVLGAVQYTVGASVSAAAAFISMGMLWPVAVVMLLSSLLALSGAIVASNKTRHWQGGDTAELKAL